MCRIGTKFFVYVFFLRMGEVSPSAEPRSSYPLS